MWSPCWERGASKMQRGHPHWRTTRWTLHSHQMLCRGSVRDGSRVARCQEYWVVHLLHGIVNQVNLRNKCTSVSKLHNLIRTFWPWTRSRSKPWRKHLRCSSEHSRQKSREVCQSSLLTNISGTPVAACRQPLLATG